MSVSPEGVAISQLANAEKKFQVLMRSYPADQTIVAWSDFLVHAQRTYDRLGKACKKGPAKGWFDKIVSLRKTDPLLLYMHQARHADEHNGLVAIEVPSLRVVNAKIKRLSFDNGKIGPGSEFEGEVEIRHVPRLIPVVNFERTYNLPDRHLGEEVEYPDRFEFVAPLQMAHLRLIIDQFKRKDF